MTCSAITNVTLPSTAGAMSPLPDIALAPIFSEASRLEHLYEQASNAIGFALNQTHSYKEIKYRLLDSLLACDSNPRYEKASLVWPYLRRFCIEFDSDETIENDTT